MRVILQDDYQRNGALYPAGEAFDLVPDTEAEALVLAGKAVPADEDGRASVDALTDRSPSATVAPADWLAKLGVGETEREPAGPKDPEDMKVDDLKAELSARGVAVPSGALKPELVETLGRYRAGSDALTVDEIKADLDTKGVEYEHGALKADLVALHEQAYPEPSGVVLDAQNGTATQHFPGMVKEPMGDGSVGGAFVESGARVNTGGPLGPARASLDDELLDADRASVFPGPSAGDAVAESGAAVNTGGSLGNGRLAAVPGGHVHIDDGVPRSDLRDVTGNISGPNTIDDGVPRSDLSSLAADRRTHDRNVKAAKGIGTKDWSPVSEEALGVGGTLADGTAGVPR